MRRFNEGLRSLVRETRDEDDPRLALLRNARAAAPAPVSEPAPAPVEQPGPPGPPVDPYAAIRNLQFYQPTVTQRFHAGHGGEGDYWEQLETPELGDWTFDFNALKPSGFQSKYNAFTDLTGDLSEEQRQQLGGRRLMQATFQDPGKHKYDTLNAMYLLDPATGQSQLLGTPGQSRQVSSGEQFRDALEEGGGFIGSMLLSAYLGGAGSGALANSIGAATGMGATASTVAANALIQGGLGGLSAEMQGGDFEKGFGRGALTGAVGSGINALVSPALSSLGESVSGYFGDGELGRAASGALRGAGSSAIGSLLRGGNSEENIAALISGGIGGGVNAGASSFLDEFDIPDPARRLLTGALTDAALGRDVQQGLLNRGIGEIFRPGDPNEAALREAYGPEGQAERMAEGNFQAQQNAPYGDYLDPFSGFGPASGVPEWDIAAAVAGVPGIGNLETDFFVDERGQLVDSGGNRGQFVDGDWVVTPPPMPSPAPAPAPAARAPAPAPAGSPPAAPPATPNARAGGNELAGLMALAAASQPRGGGGAAPYEVANVDPGVETGRRVIDSMYRG